MFPVPGWMVSSLWVDFQQDLKRVLASTAKSSNGLGSAMTDHVDVVVPFQSALQLAAIATEPIQEIADLKSHLANPTDTEEYTIQLYESARMVIDKIMQQESARRIGVLMIRSGYHKIEPGLAHPINWNAIPYAMESISPIVNDNKGIFELSTVTMKDIQKDTIDGGQGTGSKGDSGNDSANGEDELSVASSVA